MKPQTYRIALFALVLLITLACQSISNIQDQVEEVQTTAQMAATQAIGLVTQAGDLATQAVLLATQGAPLLETASAFATQNPGLETTLQALPTTLAGQGDAPADIPVVDKSSMTLYYATKDSVSYATTQDFQTVVNFYKEQMPINGWSVDEGFSLETTNTAVYSYKKDNRTATLTINANADGKTYVVIAIFSQ